MSMLVGEVRFNFITKPAMTKQQNGVLHTHCGYIVLNEQVLQEQHVTTKKGFHDKLAMYDFVHPKM